MVTWVIGINCTVAGVLLLVAWRLVALRRSLQQVNRLLDSIETDTARSLREAQISLSGGQQGLRQLGLGYRQANQRLKQVKQVLLLLSWIQGYVGPYLGSSDQKRARRPRAAGQAPARRAPHRTPHQTPGRTTS